MRGTRAIAALFLLCPLAARADNTTQQVTNQATASAAVTPSDSTVLNPPTTALFNGNASACNMALILQKDGSTVTTWNNVQPGQILPVRAKQIMAATTCSNIVAMYGP